MKSFSSLEHPSDEGIEARGSTREHAYEAAAEGLTEMMLSRIMITEAHERMFVTEAADEPSLLVRFLNHILYLFDAEHFVARTVSVRFLHPLTLECTLLGDVIAPDTYPMNAYVKAVTYHQLEISHDDHAWTIRFFVDV